MRPSLTNAISLLALMAFSFAACPAQELTQEILQNAAQAVTPSAAITGAAPAIATQDAAPATLGQAISNGVAPMTPITVTPVEAPAITTLPAEAAAPMATSPQVSAPMAYSGPVSYVSPMRSSASYGPMNIGEYPQGAACCNLAPTPTAIPCLKPVTSCCGQVGRLGVPPLSTPLRYDMPPVGKSVGRPLFGRWTGF